MHILQLPLLLLLRVLVVALELLERLCHFGACAAEAGAAAAAAAEQQQLLLPVATPRARRRRPAAATTAAAARLAGALLCSSLLCGSVGEASAAALLPPGAPARMDATTIVIESFPASSPGCSGAPTSVLRYSQECTVASGGSGALGAPLFISRVYRGASCGSGGRLETYKGKNCEAYVRASLLDPAVVAEKGLLSSVALPAGMRWGVGPRTAGSGGICDGRGTRTSCEYGRRHAAWSAAPTPVPARPTSNTFPANVGLTVVQLTPEQNAALNSGGGRGARPDDASLLLLLPLLTSSALGLLWAGQLAAS
jgi:hypothetical protein